MLDTCPASLVAMIGLACVSVARSADYVVDQAKSSDHALEITLALPEHADHQIELSTRASSLGLKQQITFPMCGNEPLPQVREGVWIAPAACMTVAWTVLPEQVRDNEVDASTQGTLWFASTGWTLLSEPTSLLRVSGLTDARTMAVKHPLAALGATPIADGIWRIPSAKNAPEFFALGGVASHSIEIPPLRVRYVADNAARVQALGLETLHKRALEFLVGVTGVDERIADRERSLLVFWIGVSGAKHQIGGAAGSRSFIANYVIGASKDTETNSARTVKILAHEQFHQLTDLVRRDASPLPTWVGESLAEYYGLKAMRRSFTSSLAQSVWESVVDPNRPADVGLLELQRRFAKGDRSQYRLFYEQGATFWNAVDSALVERNDRGSLDSLIPSLLRDSFSGRIELPDSFLLALKDRIGAKADRILARYVGR
jgi:hypothetical protein